MLKRLVLSVIWMVSIPARALIYLFVFSGIVIAGGWRFVRTGRDMFAEEPPEILGDILKWPFGS